MPVPLLDLRAQHATIREAVLAAMLPVVDDQAFILVKPVVELGVPKSPHFPARNMQ